MMNSLQNEIFSTNESNENINYHHHFIQRENENSDDNIDDNTCDTFNGEETLKCINEFNNLKIDNDILKFFFIPEKNKDLIKDKCCICLEKIDKKKVIMSGCKHQLHIKCAREWFMENAQCPLCRSQQIRLKKRICSN